MLATFAERRRKTIESMGEGVLVLFSAPVHLRNNDVEHEYRQDSDFYYLTGFEEPESVVVLTANAERPFVLFVRQRDETRETWDGERVGVDGAVSRLQADVAYPIEEFNARLLELLKGQNRLYYAVGRNPKNDAAIFGALGRLRERVRRGDACPTEIREPSTVLHQMRLTKSDLELSFLRRAIAITAEAYHSLLMRTRPAMNECELDAILRERFRSQGSARCAYPPIVASGPNSRILHHRRNDRTIGDQELVLVDAGAEYGYMAADITRTFPSNGRFSELSKVAYEIVLRAQERAIDAVKPGATLDDVHQAAVRELCLGLNQLGILTGSLDSVLEQKTYEKYYMHRTSHWLGMDVHDVGSYHVSGKPRPLVPGMVLTVEPGIYFPADDAAVPAGLRNMGIRIEDDILVTEAGHQNLSSSIVKTINDIERMMSQQSHR
jgi:Xaa-Pro aminopeptidase